ncbi:MAG: alpha/beta fold hydrolase, partial [Acholeplasma sp.]|nr:alpha/beta fold hydrolase [Acholeplasma sp.]
FVKTGYRVILHDFKGQLKSDKPNGPYSFKEHAFETVKLLENLGVKKAHFIGTSYGGEVGMKIAITYPETVLSLSIINSVSELDDNLISEIKNWEELAIKKEGYNFFWGMSKSIYHPEFMRLNHTFLMDRAKVTDQIDKSYFDGQIELYKTFLNDVYMTDELHKINAPTLVICGQEDSLKPPKFSEIIHRKVKNSEYVLFPNCGHVTIFEKPEELKTVLFGYIKKIELEK